MGNTKSWNWTNISLQNNADWMWAGWCGHLCFYNSRGVLMDKLNMSWQQVLAVQNHILGCSHKKVGNRLRAIIFPSIWDLWVASGVLCLLLVSSVTWNIPIHSPRPHSSGDSYFTFYTWSAWTETASHSWGQRSWNRRFEGCSGQSLGEDKGLWWRLCRRR